MPTTLTILMATCNGQDYLLEQLRSIKAQPVPHIDLVISDDGSTDRTLHVVADFGREWTKGRLLVVEGPRRGFAENFRSLILNADVLGDYVAFSDQDDIWLPDKLANAIAKLAADDASLPGLYCGRTEFFPHSDKNTMSVLFSRPPSFRNALVQSIAGGNTMVMNRAAFEVLRESVRRTGFVSHDWWAYLIVTGSGGKVHYSAVPDVLYRQHDTNLVGANNTVSARVERLRMLLGGQFRRWTQTNLAGLELCSDLLTPAARRQLAYFRDAHDGHFFKRLCALRRSGVYRQTWQGQAGLVIACALGLL